MLSFFKKNRNKKTLQNWRIPIATNYRRIKNSDSIQFVSENRDIILYFSVLTVSNTTLLPGDVLAKMQPSVTRFENGWQFNGTKSGGKEMLVCLFSFTHEGDHALMEDLFDSITYIGT